MNELLTVKDVAQILGLSTNTVYKYLNSGVIRSSRAQMKQGRFRVPKKAVEEFLGTPLEELESVSEMAPHQNVEVDVIEIKEALPTSPATEEKYDQLLRSLIHEDVEAAESVNSASSAAHHHVVKDETVPVTHSTEHHAAQAAQPSAASPHVTESHVATPAPTFALRATRLLLLLGVCLFVLNLAYFSAPHPIALFTQLSILFLFILLSYQYGGMRKRAV